MRTIFLILSFSALLFAEELQVVSCKAVMKQDPVPEFKILATTYKDLTKNPDKWVCAYWPCDYLRERGWFAVKKDKSAIFEWNKEKKETLNFIELYDAGKYFFTRTIFDKYDIRHFDAWEKEEAYQMQDLMVKIYTSDSECSPKKQRNYPCVPGTAFCDK